MIAFDRAERVAVGVAFVAFTGIASLALVVGTPTATAPGGTGMTSSGMTSGGTVAGTGMTSGGTVAGTGITSGGTVAGTGITSGGTVGATGMMGGGMMGGGMMGGSGAFPFLFFPLMFLAFAALIVVGSVGIRTLAEDSERDRVDEDVDGDGETDPIARIQQRYTEGELTEAEFERALERELEEEETDGDVDREGGVAHESDVGEASAERSLSGRQR